MPSGGLKGHLLMLAGLCRMRLAEYVWIGAILIAVWQASRITSSPQAGAILAVSAPHLSYRISIMDLLSLTVPCCGNLTPRMHGSPLSIDRFEPGGIA